MGCSFSIPLFSGTIRVFPRNCQSGKIATLPAILRSKENHSVRPMKPLPNYLKMHRIKAGYSQKELGEKGHVYYRCHTSGCAPTSVREERVTEAACQALEPFNLNHYHQDILQEMLVGFRNEWAGHKTEHLRSLKIHLQDIEARLARLTDALIDRLVDKETFEKRNASLLVQQKEVKDKIEEIEQETLAVPDRIQEFLELAKSALNLCNLADPEEKRDLLSRLTSNRWVDRKNVVMERKYEAELAAKGVENTTSALE